MSRRTRTTVAVAVAGLVLGVLSGCVSMTGAVQVAVGGTRACSVLEDGRVMCWGEGALGDGAPQSSQRAVTVTGLTDAVAVDVGRDHACALRAGGTVRCWGANTYGQLGNGTTTDSEVPVDVTGAGSVVEIAVGAMSTCARSSDLTVRCWGSDWSGQLGDGGGYGQSSTPVQVAGLADAAQLVAGDLYACARRTSGSVMCWGVNDYGQLGNGANSPMGAPVAVVGLSDAANLAAGRFHTCAVRSSAAVACWGLNTSGQLGDGTTADANVPVAATTVAQVSEIGLGGRHTCAQTVGGDVECWGDDLHGQLDDGGAIDVSSIDGGDTSSCVVDSAAEVRCWGSSSAGELGIGSLVRPATPQPVVLPYGLGGVAAIESGSSHSCALLEDGTVRCWGLNDGRLGDGTATDSLVPVAVVGIDDATAITVGTTHSCALLADATARCWGIANFGALGDNSTVTVAATPVEVFGLTGITSLDAGGSHTCATRDDGSLWCWGRNAAGQRGVAGAADVRAPEHVPVPRGGLVTDVDAGPSHTCAVVDDRPWCWGANDHGQLGDGTTTSRWQPRPTDGTHTAGVVVTDTDHSCSLSGEGEVWCWGDNGFGQIGDGGTTDRPAPVQVTAIRHVTAIDVGSSFTCALVESDALQRCWGRNNFGQLGTGTASHGSATPVVSLLGDVKATGVGGRTNCVVHAFGSASCLGSNNYGQIGDGTTGTYQYGPRSVLVQR